MFLTRMELDESRRNTMRALASPNIIHGTIESAFPGPRERRLWRVDRLRGGFYLLLLSRTPPDLSAAMEQFGPLGTGAAASQKAADAVSGWPQIRRAAVNLRMEKAAEQSTRTPPRSIRRHG